MSIEKPPSFSASDEEPITVRLPNLPKPAESREQKEQRLDEEGRTKEFIADWITKSKLPREQAEYATAYILRTPGTWRHYAEDSCEIADAVLDEKSNPPTLTITFEIIAEGEEDDGWTTKEVIPLSE